MRQLLLVIGLALLAAACAPAPLVVDEPEEPGVYPHHTASQIVEAMHAVAAEDDFDSYSSTGRIELTSPAQNASGNVVLRQRSDEILWASVRGPLNIEVARALVTPDSFAVHDRIQNRLYSGPAEAAQQLFPGPVGLDEVFRALTGTVVPDPDGHWFANASTLEGIPIYWLTARDGRTRIAVDPVHWRVRRFEHLTPDGQVVDRRRFSMFESVNGRVLPVYIELSNPAEQTVLLIEHRRLVLNPETLEFPFDSRGARVIPIDGPLLFDRAAPGQ
jgi:hypothetical protein